MTTGTLGGLLHLLQQQEASPYFSNKCNIYYYLNIIALKICDLELRTEI